MTEKNGMKIQISVIQFYWVQGYCETKIRLQVDKVLVDRHFNYRGANKLNVPTTCISHSMIICKLQALRLGKEFITGREMVLLPSRRGLRLFSHAMPYNGHTQHFCDMQPTNCPCLLISEKCRLEILWQRKVIWSLSSLTPKHCCVFILHLNS